MYKKKYYIFIMYEKKIINDKKKFLYSDLIVIRFFNI